MSIELFDEAANHHEAITSIRDSMNCEPFVSGPRFTIDSTPGPVCCHHSLYIERN